LIFGKYVVKDKIKEYVICFLLLESCCIGAFTSLNLLLFYLFFEFILIPMYLIIGIWGSEERIYAAVIFFILKLHKKQSDKKRKRETIDRKRKYVFEYS
jgi:NADH-quinone oxidoreductase subunit M